MKDNWHDQNWVNKWESKIANSNPTRSEQIDIVASIISDNYKPDSLILDIGCGSGQVEQLIFKKNKSLKIFGIDSSRPMLEIAKKRLRNHLNNFHCLEKDITKFQTSDLLAGKYYQVFSCQTLHEISNPEKLKLFKKIYSLLEPNGLFIIMDRIKVDYPGFKNPYKSLWERMNKISGQKNFKSYQELTKSYNPKTKQDSPATEEEYLKLLRTSKFKATTLHLHFDRAVIVGIKH